MWAKRQERMLLEHGHTARKTHSNPVIPAMKAFDNSITYYYLQPRVEAAWAAKAFQHAQVYYNLISSVDPRFLNLTKTDDLIYGEFRKTFPDLKINLLDEEDLKSEPAKEKWRPFCMQFDGVVEDFNYGTLLRLDCNKEYTEENTIFATRIQFFAIEIARNREGYNCIVYNRGRKADAGSEEANST